MTIEERITALFDLMDTADDALDKDTYEQKRRDDFDTPDDAEWSVQAGTCRKIAKVFLAIDHLRRADLLATLQQHERAMATLRLIANERWALISDIQEIARAALDSPSPGETG